MRKIGILLFALCIGVTSCKDEKQTDYLPGSIGSINTIAVVIDNDLWEGAVGDKIREHFAAPLVGLPWEEPVFTINQMPHKVFSGSIRNTRSILYVQKDSLNIAHIKSDLYAGPQKIAVIKGRTEEEIIQNIDAKADEIIAALKEVEIKVLQKQFSKLLNNDPVLQNEFGITLDIPSLFTTGKKEDNFVWIDRQIQKGTMNIIAYEMPWDSFSVDSTFVKDIVKMRDSIGKKYIPGPDVPGKITHMMTEKAFAPSVYPAEISGMKAAEVRGIWEINNYPMAGPFLTYIINDKANKRKIVLEGFTFAPATEKRDYMFQLEAILKSVKFYAPKS
ncbi:DUF4837 family protein [Spongiimicrobium salis]|uniref:DUF4837 family protein n=1 Tax=Spongiimicrobium salis TaxID=1667022 RepID=UPI00374D25CB